MRGQTLLHACIRLDAQARAHIHVAPIDVALQQDVVGCAHIVGRVLVGTAVIVCACRVQIA
eukprot:9404605-Pyramimonas_sp.AAC.1